MPLIPIQFYYLNNHTTNSTFQTILSFINFINLANFKIPSFQIDSFERYALFLDKVIKEEMLAYYNSEAIF